MTTQNPETRLTDPLRLQEALLLRLRYERAIGIETVQPVANTRPVAAQSATIPIAPATLVSPVAKPQLSSEEKEARWQALEAKAKACLQCGLRQGCKNVVFGRGSLTPKVCFVGEGPGADEDLQGLPFVGRAGQLLDKIIGAMGLKPNEFYICNVVKCRPPENRKPTLEEMATCMPFLEEQIELLQPQVIVALGGTAATGLLKTTQGIMSLRGKWLSYKGIPVMPTYHPAFVLRQYTEDVRRAVWDDMKKVMEKVSGR